MKLGRLILRVVVGGLFVGHGTQKLFGWFGGHGVEGTAGFFESVGLRPGERHARAAGTTEAVAGALFAVGLATPVAAAGLAAVMLAAIAKVHAKNGLWVTEGGFEYNLVLLAALAGLVEEGPGPLSFDAALGIERRGGAWALATLGAGAAGAAVALRSSAADGADADLPTAAEAQSREAAADPADVTADPSVRHTAARSESRLS